MLLLLLPVLLLLLLGPVTPLLPGRPASGKKDYINEDPKNNIFLHRKYPYGNQKLGFKIVAKSPIDPG